MCMHAGVGHGGLVCVCVCACKVIGVGWGYEGRGVGVEAKEGLIVAMKVCL